MARPLRLHVPGLWYHVMSRGNNKQVIFTDQRDCERYLVLLRDACQRFGVRCLAYCLVQNHVHLLLQPSDIPLARMMQQLNSVYCQWFNRRHGRVGHVLQGRYKALIVESPQYLLNVLRYILRNPVAAGLARTPAAWSWSSYLATAGLVPCPSFLSVEDVWGLLNSPDEDSGRRRFLEYVDDVEGWSLPERALILGSDEFVARFRPLMSPHRHTVDHARWERFAARPHLPELFRDATDRGSIALAARQAFLEHAYTLREIGARLKRPPATIWSWIHRSGTVTRSTTSSRTADTTAPRRHHAL